MRVDINNNNSLNNLPANIVDKQLYCETKKVGGTEDDILYWVAQLGKKDNPNTDFRLAKTVTIQNNN